MAALIAVHGLLVTAGPAAAVPTGFVEAAGLAFSLNGRPWRPIGFNQYRLSSMPGGYVCDSGYGPISDASLGQRLDDMKAATTAALANGPHTFEVRTAVTAAAADPTPASRSFRVAAADELPSAAYVASTYAPSVGQQVTFSAAGSGDPDGSIVSYRWVWGDGTPDGSGVTASHAFATAGLRSVGL